MKLMLKATLLLIAVFIIGCQNLTAPNKQIVEDSDYFPLGLGNIWYYQTWNNQTHQFENPGVIEFTKEVVNTRQLNASTFYLVETCYFNTDSSVRAKDSIYYNISGNTMYQISVRWPFEEGSKSIIAIFADTGHVSFTMKWNNDYYDAYSQFETDSTMNFVYSQPMMCDSGSELVIKKHVGFSEYISYQTPYNSRLVKYEIHNRRPL
ncbi:MAG: hypothetical protein V1773_11585 [bacterium]